jgi:endonuclease G
VTYQVIGNNHVAVPTAFYKIVVDYDSDDHVSVLAFILPNRSLTGHDLDEYLVRVDDIEAMTGLDFLTALP